MTKSTVAGHFWRGQRNGELTKRCSTTKKPLKFKDNFFINEVEKKFVKNLEWGNAEVLVDIKDQTNRGSLI